MKMEISPESTGRTVILLTEAEDSVPPGRLVEGDEAPSFRDYWHVVRKHKWKIAACFSTAVICAAVYAFSQTPIYTARATLVIERKGHQVVKIEQVLSEGIESEEQNYYQSQYEMLRSRSLAAEVIKDKGLDKDPRFTGEGRERGLLEKLDLLQKLESLVSAWFSGPNTAGSSRGAAQANFPDPFGVDSRLIDAYQGILEIEPLKKSRLVKIAFSTPDPVFSAILANAHAKAYIHQGQKLRSHASEDARNFLETKLAELKERVEKSEHALNSFRRGKGIISLNDKENIVVDRLADLNRRLTDAEAERIGLEAHARLIKQRDYDSLPAVISHGLIQNLKAQLVNLEAQYAQLETQYKLGYPPLAKIKAQIDETRQRLTDQIKFVVEGITSAYFAAVTKEKGLRAQMEKQKSEALALKDASVQYAILTREVDTNKQLYDSVFGRMKEIGVAAEIPTSNVSILDSAEVPSRPSKPQKRLTLMLGAIVGLMGGLGLALFSEHLDNTLRTPEDVERYLRVPNLVVVPDVFSLPKAERKWQFRIGRREPVPDSKLCLPGPKRVRSGLPSSMISEAYRKLRTSILLSRPGAPPRTILFTSATNGEGKTITAANTAIMLAQMGYKALVVDADLRRPSCDKALKVGRNGRGLTDFLAGQEELGKAIKPTSIPNLYLVSCGSVPPNPTELIGSKKMQETVGFLKDRFDFVLIDSPPIMPVSDAVILSAMVDGVVFVVRGQQTKKHLVKGAISQLQNGQAKILGVVLNQVDIRSAEYADYYRPSYAPYYSYSNGADASQRRNSDLQQRS